MRAFYYFLLTIMLLWEGSVFAQSSLNTLGQEVPVTTAEGKGNRRFFTNSIGMGGAGFTLDFQYLHPLTDGNNPLDNTFRLTFGFSMKLDGGFPLRFDS